MSETSFIHRYSSANCILGEGAVIERLRRDTRFELDPYVVNSGFCYEPDTLAAITAIYRQYLDIGYASGLPVMLSTPTWRANRERIKSAGFKEKNMNADNYRFLDELRKHYGPYSESVFISGLLSCANDAYNPAQALDVDEARRFHSWQTEKLAATGVDFLLAATLPALTEAMGLAMAMAETHKPYMISFVARPEGTLLDGTPLLKAISDIDTKVTPAPLAYLVNCTHPSIFRSALTHKTNISVSTRQRIAGLLANTAALSPEELDNRAHLVEADPDSFGKSVADLRKDFGMKLLGGCCGTDERHIRSLARHLVSNTDDGVTTVDISF